MKRREIENTIKDVCKKRKDDFYTNVAFIYEFYKN